MERNIILLAVLTLCFIHLIDTQIPASGQELIIYRLIESLCPGSEAEALTESSDGASLYSRLLNKLVECRQNQSGIFDPVTTQKPEPVTLYKTPKECLTATSFTESWRFDRAGQNHTPGGAHSSGGYACDMNTDSLDWFRFSSKGSGSRMLNVCPEKYSCGAAIPFWSDETAPSRVGELKAIHTYAVRGSNCKSYTKIVYAMQCSPDENDIIYKVRDRYSGLCGAAFCAMKAK